MRSTHQHVHAKPWTSGGFLSPGEIAIPNATELYIGLANWSSGFGFSAPIIPVKPVWFISLLKRTLFEAHELPSQHGVAPAFGSHEMVSVGRIEAGYSMDLTEPVMGRALFHSSLSQVLTNAGKFCF